MDQSVKLKNKHSSSQLVWTTEYELISPYSVEKCISQLEALREKYRFKRPQIWNMAGFYFDEIQVDNGIVQFGIKASTGKIGIDGKIIGYLNRQSDGKTNAKFQIGFTYSSVVIQILLSPFVVAMFLLMRQVAAGLIALTLVYGFLTIFSLASCSDLKKSLYRIICEALDLSEVPPPQTMPP